MKRMREKCKRLLDRLKFSKSLRLIFFIIIFMVGVVPCSLLKRGILHDYEQRAVDVRVEQVRGQLRSLANHLISSNYLVNQDSGQVDAELSEFSTLYDGRLLVIDPSLTVVKDTYGLSEYKTIVSQDVVSCLQTGDRAGSYSYDRQYGFIELVVPIIETRSREGLDSAVDRGEESGRGRSQRRGARRSGSANGGGPSYNNGSNGAAAGKMRSRETTNSVRGVLLASTSTEYIQRTKDILQRKSMYLQLLMLGIVFLASFLLSGLLVRPFEKLSRDIRGVKEGYSNEPIQAPDYIETVHIAEAFNTVLGRMNALNQSRQEFVANVSHELKTPMTSMKLLASSLLSEETVDPAVYREFLEDIDGEIDRENKTISDLLELVREDRTEIELDVARSDINVLAEAVLNRMRPIAMQRDVALTLVCPRREIYAEVDAARISLLLTNLVENAIKYNREHGEVVVTLDADDRYFEMRVRDNGIGIPEKVKDKIFERFYRVDKSRSREIGGTGLGLSIAKSVVQRHFGRIDVETQEGAGTTFTVRIPLLYAEEPMELRADGQKRLLPFFPGGRGKEKNQKKYFEKTIRISRRREKKKAHEKRVTSEADGRKKYSPPKEQKKAPEDPAGGENGKESSRFE